jgi:hypothetical protein
MIRIFRWLFVTTGVIGFLLIAIVSSHHRGHEDDFKTCLIGIGIIISSIAMLVVLYNIELYLEKHKEKLNKNKKRFVISILLIVAGVICLIDPLVDLIQNTSKNADGIMATIGIGYLIVGFLLYPSTT